MFGLVQINTIKLAQGGDAKVQAAFDDARSVPLQFRLCMQFFLGPEYR